jgi:hypothetical protein
MNKLWKASALLAGTMFAAMPVTTMADEIDFMVIDYDAPGMGEWWHLLVDTYNSNSGHTVVPRNTPASEYYSQLTIQAVSGAGADVVIVNPNNLGEMLAGKLVMPLTRSARMARSMRCPLPGARWNSSITPATSKRSGFPARQPHRRNSSTTPESWSCTTTGAV